MQIVEPCGPSLSRIKKLILSSPAIVVLTISITSNYKEGPVDKHDRAVTKLNKWLLPLFFKGQTRLSRVDSWWQPEQFDD